MNTERMIRELRNISEKHKDDSVFTGHLNLSLMCRDVADRLEDLKRYEDTGLTPEEFVEQTNAGWIPVEERLPKRTLDEKMNKSYKKYLVFIDSVDGWDIDIAVYDFWNDKKWCEAHDGYGEIENVIAWRPLPDPYRPVTKP